MREEPAWILKRKKTPEPMATAAGVAGKFR
jgi:hypothetical protein